MLICLARQLTPRLIIHLVPQPQLTSSPPVFRPVLPKVRMPPETTASMLPLRLPLPRQGRVLRPPRHILTSEQRQVVLSNCRLTLPAREPGKLIKHGTVAFNRRLRLPANRHPLGSRTPLSRIRSLSLLTRERSVLVYGRTPLSSLPSQPTILLDYLQLWTKAVGRMRRLPHYRRRHKERIFSILAHHMPCITTQITLAEPSTIRIWMESSVKETSSLALQPTC